MHSLWSIPYGPLALRMSSHKQARKISEYLIAPLLVLSCLGISKTSRVLGTPAPGSGWCPQEVGCHVLRAGCRLPQGWFHIGGSSRMRTPDALSRPELASLGPVSDPKLQRLWPGLHSPYNYPFLLWGSNSAVKVFCLHLLKFHPRSSHHAMEYWCLAAMQMTNMQASNNVELVQLVILLLTIPPLPQSSRWWQGCFAVQNQANFGDALQELLLALWVLSLFAFL